MKTILNNLISFKHIKESDIKYFESYAILDDQFFFRDLGDTVELYILHNLDSKYKLATSNKLSLYLSHVIFEGLIEKLIFPTFSGELVDNLIDRKLSLNSKTNLNYKSLIVLVVSKNRNNI